eukprot:106384_1
MMALCPINYLCFKCKMVGDHWIFECQTNECNSDNDYEFDANDTNIQNENKFVVGVKQPYRWQSGTEALRNIRYNFETMKNAIYKDPYYNEHNDIKIINDVNISNYPYTLRCFIKWIYFIENESKIIDLDFNKIDKDLNYQYSWYNDKFRLNELRNIYFSFKDIEFCHQSEEFKQQMEINKKLFHGQYSIIHYILCSSIIQYTEKIDIYKFNKYKMLILELLFKYNIITGK